MREKAPTRKLSGRTLVFHEKENEQLQWLKGVVPLPVGTEIELVDPNMNARVVRVRLLAGEPADLCLDVELVHPSLAASKQPARKRRRS